MRLLKIVYADAVADEEGYAMNLREINICDTCKNSEVVRADSGSIHMRCKKQDKYVNSFENCSEYGFDEVLLGNYSRRIRADGGCGFKNAM
jgi:hypothetical protein